MSNHESTEALSLRVQALALLQQAQQIDGLKPILINHRHQYGSTGYLVWSAEDLTEKVASKMTDSNFEPELDETLDIESVISLEQVAGTDITQRVPDVLKSSPIDDDDDSGDHSDPVSDSFPQAYHTAINRLDYGTLQTILEDHGFAVNSSESADDLRQAVRQNVLDGTISKSVMDIYAGKD